MKEFIALRAKAREKRDKAIAAACGSRNPEIGTWFDAYRRVIRVVLVLRHLVVPFKS